ncbi:hypothetical protein [Paenibacillus thermotolerans]|uniref:hypothetical protein n=1 Tax=Paenibacillus thermotolerans TaxID=3027807 RepID=UPI002367F925|nr:MULTISPECIES: hypothetical protein [unclassified Paenibacillus]
MRRKPRILFIAILSYVALSFYEPFWRLLVRGLMEPNFMWSYAGLNGTGLSGDYWVIFLIALFGTCMLFWGWRGGHRIVDWGIFIWVALLFCSSLAIILSEPETKITAETLHMELPYIWVVFPVDALFFVLTAIWMIFFRKRTGETRAAEWNRLNGVLLGIAAGMLPVEYFLFNSGEQHGLFDRLGVFATLVQWVILNTAFLPSKSAKKRSFPQNFYGQAPE